MKLLLASNAHVMLPQLLPHLAKSPQNMRVAFVPTASDVYDEYPWVENDRAKLAELGFDVFDVDIKGKTAEQLRSELTDIDMLIIAGGNTSYLLEKAQESGFLEVIKDLVGRGVVYVGSSAEALLACPDIEVDRIYDDGEFGKILSSYGGLGFVDFVIVPHADNMQYASYHERVFKEFGDRFELKKLNDNQAFYVEDRKVDLVEVE